MALKVAIGTLLTAINKRLCFEQGVKTTALQEQCERSLRPDATDSVKKSEVPPPVE